MTRRPAANLLIHLDHRDRGRGTLQEQIYAGIRRAILSGVMRPGTRLASSRALARDLGVSRTTTQLALEQLEAEGYLTAQRGSGTFVAEALPDDLPQIAAHGPPAALEHPPLSRRGALLAACKAPARRIAGPPRPFRLGVPALEHFPVRVWSRLASRRIMSITSTQLDYGKPAGLPALREAIAEHARAARGARCDADQIIIVGSAQRGLDVLCQMLLDPGDQAIVEDPGYPGAWTAILAAGGAIAPVPVDRDGLDLEAAAPCGRVRLAYVTPSHQFPLGVPMSLPRRLSLLRWASAAGAWVVEDDYDAEFRHGAQPVPCLQGLDPDGRVIYVGSFSKSIFPALRLGYLIAPVELVGPLLAARRAGADPQPPFLEQAVLADFIGGGHFARHLRRMRAIYRERLDALTAAAERYCGGVLDVRPVRTGLHAVADVRGADPARVFDEALARGVECMPLADYVRGSGRADSALVLGFGAVGPAALTSGMRSLAAAIESAQRPGGWRAPHLEAHMDSNLEPRLDPHRDPRLEPHIDPHRDPHVEPARARSASRP
ncbi:MAG TPA: PLP-dependent aminotransferase family protein [Kofleriaceae bacterium]|nr:PLP-dependent aminotransferase family protein [Kofleriaceae bacterium]